jgi:DNA-binding protein YbaB
MSAPSPNLDRMDEPATSPASPGPGLDELRARARSDDGLVTAVVDGSGRLLELRFEPTAMRKPSAELADLARGTVVAAQDAAREQARARLDAITAVLPPPDELTTTLQQLQATATTKLAEMSATLQQLIDRAEGGTR